MASNANEIDPQKADPIRRQGVYDGLVKQALSFYTAVTTVATGFLGGSLLFIEKIASKPSICSLALLGVGWSLLIISIGAVTWVRRANLKSAQRALEYDKRTSSKVDYQTDFWSTVVVWSLSFGMLFVSGFGLWNVVNRLEAEKKAGEQQIVESGVVIEEGTKLLLPAHIEDANSTIQPPKLRLVAPAVDLFSNPGTGAAAEGAR